MAVKWLVIGGAGYIGSHVLREFISQGHECVVLDNLSTGIRNRLPENVVFIDGDARDSQLVIGVCKEFGINSILHFAAFMQARESVSNPIKYWENNINTTLGIAQALSVLKIDQLIFSSSCSVYGNNPRASINSVFNPLSPYAMTKVASEQILTQACLVADVKLSIMRYFNVVGCGDFEDSLESSTETLVPSIMNSILVGQPFQIYGDRFDTVDGTAMRDYLDVRDLASAHLVASRIDCDVNPVIYNVSSGVGTTVKQIVETLSNLTSSNLLIQYCPPKTGDPAVISAEADHMLSKHGWEARISLKTSLLDYVMKFNKQNTRALEDET